MTAADADRIGPLTARHWALVLALIATASIADDLLRMPVQVRDALEEILAAYRSSSVLDSFWTASFNAAYLRPLRIAQIKALFDLAGGNYWLAYRGFHVLLLAACMLLFTRALHVRTATDLVAAAFALTVLTGLHTFRSLIQEAFPINHFLEIAVFALATLNLAQGTRRVWTDLTALLLFAAASLTLESGLLIWVVAVSGWIFGLRGISGRGVLLMTGLLGVYFYLRFVSLAVGVPTLAERSSGYFFGVLEPEELQARFGHRVWWFRGYNVVASIMSVLFSEPQSGVFATTRSWKEAHVVAWQVIAAVSSLITTGVIAVVAVGHSRRRLRPAPASAADGAAGGAADGARDAALLGVGATVLIASAVLSFAYTKDDIMSTAGVFYALAAYVSVRHVLTACAGWRAAKTAAVVALLFLAAATWSVRSLGIHHVASAAAFKTRNDWAFQPDTWKREGRWPARADEQRLLQRLRAQALAMPAPNPTFDWRWADRVWGD